MQPSYGMIFVFLLVRLQWNKSNAEGREVNATSGSITEKNQSTLRTTSQRSVLLTTATINPSTISLAVAATIDGKQNVIKRTEMSSWPHSTTSRSSGGTTLPSEVTTVPKDGINNSTARFNSIPTSLMTFTTMGDSSGVTKSAADSSTSTATPSNATGTYSSTLAAALPSENSSVNPTSITPTWPAVKQHTPTPNPTEQATELNQNFSNPATASSNSKDVKEDKTNKGGVIVGIIVGAILGSILIGLTGYFICVKKRSDSFSHRRLYDDTRNDPVLHLDNSLGPYDTSFGCVSDDKTSTGDKAEEDKAGWSSDGIPMADMTPSHPSP